MRVGRFIATHLAAVTMQLLTVSATVVQLGDYA